MMIENTGIAIKDIDRINEVFSEHPEIKRVLLYGSRSLGSYRPASNVDLTLIGQDIDLTLQNKIELELDDLMLPYKFDLSVYHKIVNPDFLDHINKEGREFYLCNRSVLTKGNISRT